jgi:hypothetical protein
MKKNEKSLDRDLISLFDDCVFIIWEGMGNGTLFHHHYFYLLHYGTIVDQLDLLELRLYSTPRSMICVGVSGV